MKDTAYIVISGELLTRGHNIMIGYWRDEQKTKEVIDSANWYRTGSVNYVVNVSSL